MAPEFLYVESMIAVVFLIDYYIFVWSSEIAISYRRALEDTFVLQLNLFHFYLNCFFN